MGQLNLKYVLKKTLFQMSDSIKKKWIERKITGIKIKDELSFEAGPRFKSSTQNCLWLCCIM